MAASEEAISVETVINRHPKAESEGGAARFDPALLGYFREAP
jgi:hypothetical protein